MSASRDDTLYQALGDQQRNNGAGQWLFAGRTGGGDIRRGLIAFDIAAGLPAGATVKTVTLTLTVSRTVAGDAEVGLHRVRTDWQEGTGDAPNNEGQGIEAVQGDVTWTQRVFGSQDWGNPGGDFAGGASAVVTVQGEAAYTWESTSQLVADVQSWLDDPAANFGWLVLGDESKAQTTKRFNSSENEDQATRPELMVVYSQ